MNTTFSKSEIFSLMNRLKKEKGISQKEAYAMAKAQLMQSVTSSENTSTLADTLIAKMKDGNVKFKFMNRGREIITTGTLNMAKVPINRKVEGSQVKKNDNMVIFYDVRHGVYRQFDRNSILAILSK